MSQPSLKLLLNAVFLRSRLAVHRAKTGGRTGGRRSLAYRAYPCLFQPAGEGKDSRIVINYSRCIRCFCYNEVYSKKAIDIKKIDYYLLKCSAEKYQ